jgi:hypothetical protein
MKNQVIRERYAALTMLGGRILPSPTAINKVTTLLRRFKSPYEATEAGRKSVIETVPLPDGWDKDTLPLEVAEQRQKAMDEYMEQDQPVKKIPEQLRLTMADMPKVLKRDGGESNVEGIAGIIVALGPLFVRSEEEKKLDVATEGFEEDEEAPAEEVEEVIGSGHDVPGE